MFTIPSMLPSKLLGIYGEIYAREYFKDLGFNVSRPQHADLLLDDHLRLEIKTVRKNKDETYAATIRKTGSQSIDQADFIILYIVSDIIYPYIIPAKSVPFIKRIHITSHPTIYVGKYSIYLENYYLLFSQC